MVLICGPTGSGKSTTLYATLRRLNALTDNILTIEDPIEYTLEGVNQMQLKEEIGLTFTAALRTFLRQDPDIIMLGEIRDGATAEMAVRSSLTGHLLFSTIHTNTAWGAVARLSDMGVHPYLVADTLVMTVAQRLARLLCPHCKRHAEATDEVRHLLPGIAIDRYCEPVGCERCFYTGYAGRRAVYEVIPMDDELAAAVRSGRDGLPQALIVGLAHVREVHTAAGRTRHTVAARCRRRPLPTRRDLSRRSDTPVELLIQAYETTIHACVFTSLHPACALSGTAGRNTRWCEPVFHRTVAPNPPSDPDSLRLSRIDSELAALVGRDSTFRREVDVTSGRLSLSELLRNIARASGVNVSVRSVEKIPVSCNFRRARVDDLVRFLCREYRLDVAASGNILSIFPAAAPTVPAPDPDVAYAAADTTLTYDLRGERLIDVAKKIARLSARNVIVPEPLYDCKVSGYVRRMPFDDALRTLAAVNGLLAERDAQDVWTLWREEPAAQGGKRSAGPAYMRRRQFTPNELRVDSLGRITARIARGNVQDVILDLCDELELNYYFQSPVNLTAGVWVDGTDFETLLSVLLKGSPYSYYTERGIWIFGAAATDGLSSATVLPLVYRAVSKVEEIIPEALKQNVAVKTFPDLNALILSGDRRDVARVETFLRSVDKPVPMVTMEILIADVTKSRIHEIGLGAGVGDKAVKTSGTLSPGVDMTFSSGAVNDLLGRIRGTVNLGRVTPNFYLSLQALEEDGVVRLLSTPKLSTLNGHEATLTSGETQYYKEVQNNYYGTQNPISSESYQWKSVDANLSIKVTPYVSEDRQITLEIEFEQTEFTDRNVEDAPPGTATRSFKSIVKVQNEEMVLLGGLDRNTMENSSRGVPFLARVPVIKWFFGKEKRNKVERTLNIFIKPTVVE